MDGEEVARFIARDSPRYALVLQREAQEAAQSLRQFARRGRIVPERVIAFLNSARDLDAFLKRERD